MEKYYLGFDYYSLESDRLVGCMGWDFSGKEDNYYSSKEDLVRDVIENAVKEDMEALEQEKEAYLPVYSLEVKMGDKYRAVEYYISIEHVEKYGITAQQLDKLKGHITEKLEVI